MLGWLRSYCCRLILEMPPPKFGLNDQAKKYIWYSPDIDYYTLNDKQFIRLLQMQKPVIQHIIVLMSPLIKKNHVAKTKIMQLYSTSERMKRFIIITHDFNIFSASPGVKKKTKYLTVIQMYRAVSAASLRRISIVKVFEHRLDYY